MKAKRDIAAEVLAVVAEVPAGRVTTYGLVAAALDVGPRQVASILAHDPDAASVPWHRVVAAGGKLTIPDADNRAEQAARLKADGVVVEGDRVRNVKRTVVEP